MKKLTSLLNRATNRHYLFAWIIFHVLIFLCFALTFAFHRGQMKMDADLFNMLPKPFEGKSLAMADAKLTELTGQSVFILVSNPEFDEALAVADKVYNELKTSTKFKSLELYQDEQSVAELSDVLFKYRWNLLSQENIDFINTSDGPQEFAQIALEKAYTGFTATSLEHLDKDPFMLTENAIENYQSAVQKSGVALSPRNGVLSTTVDGISYVMIRGNLSDEGAALASDRNAVVLIRSVCKSFENESTKFIFSGTPFHSYKSSTSAVREVKIISVISIVAVLIILLVVFRNPLPIVMVMGSILVSSGTAFAMTMFVFKKMHVLSLIFGTSLIGSCIDYSLHYFVNWKGNRDLNSGSEVRRFLFPGLTMSLISTEICFLILLFAPFNLLKQMAVFSMAGIFSSYLSVICVFPLVKIAPDSKRNIGIARMVRMPEWYNKKKVGRCAITLFFVFSILTLFFGFKNIRVENDISKLYTMEGELLEHEIESTRILKYRPTGWYVLSGETKEDLLQREENLVSKLNSLDSEKNPVGFMCLTSFIPSIQMQKKSREACEKLLALSDAQLEALGFDSSTAENLRKEFIKSENDFIEPEMEGLPQIINKSVSNVWLGNLGGKYYSVVIPNQITDEKAFKEICADDKDIFLVQKVKDISRDMDILTSMVLKLFAVAYVVIFIVFINRYKKKQALKIVSIPLLIILMTSAFFSLAKIHLEFFSITGLILVFGLGLDYIIYMIEYENRENKNQYSHLEPFAVLLSFITTAISFGALALSSFKPVHLIGLAIFIGLVTAYLSSFFYDRSEE